MEALGRVCLEEAANWARERNTFGKRLADHQVIRHKFAQMKQKLNATQAYIRVCYESIEAATRIRVTSPCSRCRRARHWSSVPARRCRFSAVSVTCAAAAVERIYREVRVNAIGGGSEEIMRDLAARQYGL
jgi:acyl-CoA dehydrogenase